MMVGATDSSYSLGPRPLHPLNNTCKIITSVMMHIVKAGKKNPGAVVSAVVSKKRDCVMESSSVSVRQMVTHMVTPMQN